MKAFSSREFAKLLEINGFTLDRVKGSHFVYKRNERILVLPKNLNKMIGRRLIKEYQLQGVS